jgi:hypothetical protein
MVLLFGIVFNILGLGLLELALAEYRISRNVALYDRLFYYAEAGLEEAVAGLPRDGDLFAGYTASFERVGEAPFFQVAVLNSGAGKLIRSVGRAEGKSRPLTVRADILLCGGYALLAGGEVKLGGAEVHGNVGGGEIVFVGGSSVVHGSLFTGAVRVEWGAAYALAGGGRQCPVEHTGNLELDFGWYADRAFFLDHRWHIPVIMDNYYWEGMGEITEGLVYVPGDLVVGGDFVFEGVLVVRGRVEFGPELVAGNFVLLAEGDVVLAAEWEQAGGSVFIYSGGDITDGRAERVLPLVFGGVLVAAGNIELPEAAVSADETAFALYRGELEPGAFSGIASFRLEYIDSEPRR